jgi:mRNA-degrading endonuclease RelE of RelBE toxin-antitoxin system
MPFQIEFSREARVHLKSLRKRDQQTILDAVSLQLSDQPDEATRNRKRLAPSRLAPWELRIGKFRVFYDIVPDRNLVVVLAVGAKEHNRLFIAGEEIEL